MEEYKSITDKLHAYEKQWTDMDYTIGHLRQENAQLKAELLCKETEWAKIFESLKAEALGWRKLAGENGTIADNHIRELQRHKAALEKCREALRECKDVLIKASNMHDMTKCSNFIDKFVLGFTIDKAISDIDQPNPQPTQDSATAIAYGLYPSSARPVNPKPSQAAPDLGWLYPD